MLHLLQRSMGLPKDTESMGHLPVMHKQQCSYSAHTNDIDVAQLPKLKGVLPTAKYLMEMQWL